MESHWKDIGFVPDSTTAAIEDEDTEVDIQIGRRENIEKRVATGPDLTARYTSLMISGFNVEQNLVDVHQVLLQHGLPWSVSSYHNNL